MMNKTDNKIKKRERFCSTAATGTQALQKIQRDLTCPSRWEDYIVPYIPSEASGYQHDSASMCRANKREWRGLQFHFSPHQTTCPGCDISTD